MLLTLSGINNNEFGMIEFVYEEFMRIVALFTTTRSALSVFHESTTRPRQQKIPY